MQAEIVKPMEIEKRSFEIITQRLNGRVFGRGTEDIVKRVIHTTADFDYADNLVFSPNVVEQALEALKKGAVIVTDTTMAYSGINKAAASTLGCSVRCFIADEDVAQEAKQRGITRSMVSMERMCSLGEDNIIAVVGNAPTALIQIDELIRSGRLMPKLVIGVPVGFVNVVEAKELIMDSGVPYIAAKGNKGGSNVAAAIVNALMYKLVR